MLFPIRTAPYRGQAVQGSTTVPTRHHNQKELPVSLEPKPEPQLPAPTGQIDPWLVLGVAIILGSTTAYVTDWEHAVLVFTSVLSLFRRTGDPQ